MKILNFGSLNIDITYHVPHFVRPGETLASNSRMTACGGKGLNQSIAVARSGAPVWHAGAVGKADGAILLDALKEAGVNTDHVRVREDVPSGTAFIQVNREGENCIVLDGGANQAITKETIDEVLSHFGSGDWLVLQNEISELSYLIEQAHAKGMKVFLDPSPITPSVFDLPLSFVDCFLLNEIEANELTNGADDVIAELEHRYPGAMFVITYGSKGCICVKDGTCIRQEAFPAEAVDTVGAGDTFTGFLIGSLAMGTELPEALRIASKAAAISVTRKGASTSIPSRSEVLNALA